MIVYNYVTLFKKRLFFEDEEKTESESKGTKDD